MNNSRLIFLRYKISSLHFVSCEPPNPADRAPGVREETADRVHYKVNGSSEMTEVSLVQARGVCRATGEPA